MKTMNLRFHAGLLLAALTTAQAHATTSPAVQNEIASLLTGLQRANCQFNRNGSWYGADEARQHIQRKIDYIEERGGFKSTEQFIETVATQSSMSGEAYQVRCAQAAAVPSAQWMQQQLKQLRTIKRN